MLKLLNITKSFPQRGIVLDELSLEVNEGETLAVTGPSGSGKSTLLNIIGSLDKPDSGEIMFMGKNIAEMNMDESAAYRNRNIGFVFQDHLLLPHLTVMENILLPLYASDLSDADYAQKADYAGILAEKTGITGIMESYPFRISGGEAQRVALVRALVNNPSLLLADEPTGSLDSRNAELLADLLKDLNKETGISMILATHSIDLASRMERHLMLEDGKLK